MSSPVPLKAAVYMYHKGTNENWITGRAAANGMVSAARAKADAAKWVFEKQGMYYTIRLMNTRRYLAAGSVTKTGDCTAVLTNSPTGMAHMWNVTTSSTGIRIGTVAACRERGSNVKQFLKIANTGGAHLELASKDSDVFYVVRANATSPPAVTVRPSGTPAAVRAVSLRMKPVSQIPKIVAIEPYLRPRYYLAPNVIPTGSGKEGSVQMTVTRTFWYTQPTQNTISFLTGPTGPHLATDKTCSSPILYSGALTTRARFYIATLQGAQGFVLKTANNACGDGRARYLVTHTNGRPGVSKTAPTQKTMLQYLWRFTVGSVTAPPSVGTQSPLTPTEAPTVPVVTPASTPIPSPTSIPIPSPTFTPIEPSTLLPTMMPTASPTLMPTDSPTMMPTLPPEEIALPTFGPTFAPTSAPTTIPTFDPIPTLTPTMSPTESPTMSPTESPTMSPTGSPFESPSSLPTLMPTMTPSGGPSGSGFPGSININIEDARKWGKDRVVFPYPVAPDLLLASNPDGSLVLPDGTAVAETTVPPSATPNASTDPENDETTGSGDGGDVLFPDFEDGEDGEGDVVTSDDTNTEQFWTMPRIALALIAFIVIAIIAYYVYQAYATSNGNGNGGANGGKNGTTTINGTTTGSANARGAGGNTGNTGRTNGTNIGANALNGLAPPADNLGNLGNFGNGNAGNTDAFGDGFNDFANVNDIGPPPPTGR